MSLNSIVVIYPPQQIDHIVGITKFTNFNLREDPSLLVFVLRVSVGNKTSVM